MNTLTLFNAYVAASRQSHATCVHIAAHAGAMPVREMVATVKRGRRRERQIETLERVIRARLTSTQVREVQP